MIRLPARVATVSLCVMLIGCGEGSESAGDGPFFAMKETFADFLSWRAFVINDPHADARGETHRAYINQLPAAGSTVFPKGTVIVKTEEASDQVESWHVYAMAKREGGFNATGAPGWEWFGLIPMPGGKPFHIDWRGEEPKSGAVYRCVEEMGPQGPSCNECHRQARHNDFVISPALDLHDLAP